MDLNKSLAISVFAGILAVLFFTRTYNGLGIYSLTVIFIGVAWLAFSFTDPDRMLQFLGFLQNPPMTAVMTFFGVFIYMTYNAYPPGQSFMASFVAALFGGLLGALIFNYWNIGS